MAIIWCAMSDPETLIIGREERVQAVKVLWPKLSPRQVECLCLRVMGFTQEEIGQVLDVEQHTVSEHLDKIWEKLG